jgi:hypothetical protein
VEPVGEELSERHGDRLNPTEERYKATESNEMPDDAAKKRAEERRATWDSGRSP